MIRGLLIGVGACLVFAGCVPGQPGDNPAAFLEGTWTVTPEDPGDFENVEYEAVFDSDGELTQVTATRDDGATATLDATDATTTVDGDEVTISIPRAGGTSVFTGTVSEDQNTITGSLTQEIDLGDLEIVVPSGNITFARVAE